MIKLDFIKSNSEVPKKSLLLILIVQQNNFLIILLYLPQIIEGILFFQNDK